MAHENKSEIKKIDNDHLMMRRKSTAQRSVNSGGTNQD